MGSIIHSHKDLIRAFVPITARSVSGKLINIGTLEAGYNISRKNTIDDTELEMLKSLANQAAIAILYAKEKDKVLSKKVSELKTLHNIGIKVTEQTNLENVLNNISVQTLAIFPPNLCLRVFLYNKEKRVLDLKSSLSSKDTLKLPANFKSIPVKGIETKAGMKSIIAAAFRDEKTKIVPDVRENPLYYKTSNYTLSELDIPFIYKDKVIGVLNVESDVKDGFNEEMLNIMENFAQQAAIAIGNAETVNQLKRSKKQMDDLILITSHDMGSPLVSLKETVNSLKLHFNKNEIYDWIKSKDWIKRMQIAIHKLSFLQENSLTATKFQWMALNFEIENNLTISLCNSIEYLMSYAEMSKGIKFDLTKLKGIPPVLIVKNLINQAIANIVDNAIKYSEEKTIVTIKSSVSDDKKCVMISISNNGIPIYKKDEIMILEKYRRADNAQCKEPTGNGIGLWLVNEIINAHNGKLSFNSKRINSSIDLYEVTFIVTLPIYYDN